MGVIFNAFKSLECVAFINYNRNNNKNSCNGIKLQYIQWSVSYFLIFSLCKFLSLSLCVSRLFSMFRYTRLRYAVIRFFYRSIHTDRSFFVSWSRNILRKNMPECSTSNWIINSLSLSDKRGWNKRKFEKWFKCWKIQFGSKNKDICSFDIISFFRWAKHIKTKSKVIFSTTKYFDLFWFILFVLKNLPSSRRSVTKPHTDWDFEICKFEEFFHLMIVNEI